MKKERLVVEELLNRIRHQFLHQFPNITDKEREQFDTQIGKLLTLEGYKMRYNPDCVSSNTRCTYPLFVFDSSPYLMDAFTHSITPKTYIHPKVNHEKIARELETTLTRLFTINPHTFPLSKEIHTHPNIKEIQYGEYNMVKIVIQSALSREVLHGLASNPVLDVYLSKVNQTQPSLLHVSPQNTANARCSRMKQMYEQRQYKEHLEFRQTFKCELRLYKFTKEQEKEIFE